MRYLELGYGDDSNRYDANKLFQRPHLVCVKCGLMHDFYSDVLDRFPVPREVAEMGSVDWVYVQLRRRCRERQPGRKNRKMR